MDDKMGDEIHLVHHIPGKSTALVEKWFCEVIIQGEQIMNYQFECKNIEYRVIRINFGPTRQYFVSTQKSGLKF